MAHPVHNTRSGQTKSGTSIFMDFTARQLHSPNSVVQSTWDKTTTHIKHAQWRPLIPSKLAGYLDALKGLLLVKIHEMRIKSQLMIKKMGDRGVQFSS
uniref:Uncharacterized protein n=1 Tax=Oryza glumipatula TaxID=40148 RepID=A0A0E0BKN3_9ORYZ